MARTHFAVAAVLLLACAALGSSAACTPTIASGSAFFGGADKAAADKYVNQAARWQTFGDITRLEVYYSSTAGCIYGIKPTYGRSAANAALLGLDKMTGLNHTLTLGANETIIKVQHKSGGKCIEYISLSTTKNRTFSVGNIKSATATATLTPPKAGAFLASIRGWVTKAGALQALQLVWGARDCPAAAPSPAASPKASPKPAAASPSPAASPKASPAASPKAAPKSSPTPTPTPTPSPAATPSPSPSPVPVAERQICAPKLDMCDETSLGLLNTCRAARPFTSSKCVGGCCISSGKCKYGNCFANGLGTDAGLACFGTNALPSPLALLGNRCGHLACKLAVPGCKTTFLGGNCVGTVVALANASQLHPQGAQYVGHPCIESLPTSPLAQIASKEFIWANWKVCNCIDKAYTLPTFNLSSFHLPSLKIPGVSSIKLPTIGISNPFANKAAPSPSPASDDGGDASLGAGGGLTALKDLVFGGLSSGSGSSDPFSDFITSDNSTASAAAGTEEAGAALDAGAGGELDAGALAADDSQSLAA